MGSCRFFLSALSVLFVCSSASAYEYARYMMGCTLTGTQQTMSTSQEALPFKVTLTTTFVEIVGSSLDLKKVTRGLRSSGGFKLGAVLKGWTVTPAVSIGHCHDYGVQMQPGELDNRLVRKLLIAMGAQGVPQLPEGKVKFQNLMAGYVTESDWGGCKDDHTTQDTVLAQIHFEDKYDGLSYHLKAEKCFGYRIGPDGEKRLFGQWSSRTGD